MAITPIQNLISTVLSSPQPAAPAASSGNNTATTAATVNNTSVSSTPAPLLASANLQNTSVGLAQLSSLLEEAQSGTQAIGSILQQLESLAGQAQSGGPPSALAALDSEFQELLSQINQVAASTSFGGTSLLDGSLSGQGANDNAVSSSLAIPNLTTEGLFGSTPPNLLSVTNASNASAAITNAQNIVNGAGDTIATTQAEVNYASANVDSALANNNAAASVLSESDLAEGATGDLLTGLLSNLGTTASAQTGNLPGTLLSLLQE